MFLALKFSECIGMYYNQKILQTAYAPVLLFKIQKALEDDHKENQFSYSYTVPFQQKPCLIVLKNRFPDLKKNKKVVEFLNSL